MRGNIISIEMKPGGEIGYASGSFQYDRGQRLMIGGCELPEIYQAHFCNDESGISKTVTGDATGVDIPDEFFQSGKDIHVYVYVVGQDHAETEYHGVIHVEPRAKPTSYSPNPAQKATIDRLIEQMTGFTDENRRIREEIDQIADGLPILETFAEDVAERAMEQVGELVDDSTEQALRKMGLYFDEDGDLCQEDEPEDGEEGEENHTGNEP